MREFKSEYKAHKELGEAYNVELYDNYDDRLR